ncbi:MAG: cytochrome c oxidase subunit II [Ignavibacterium sp.]|nr:cytochrome c oxidase subunit II [Ignavibacterium sp.]MCX7612215.1 cytochrome c oxidase subunit II [Ignavibacterium sp.]MDW8375099.1 cytochrome c oxidase subunit II [Ignavibacteriales bacterium]
MFDGASNFSYATDFTFLFTIIVSGFFLLLITFLMIYFVIKYNRKRNPVAENISHNTTLEIVWTVVPLILVLTMFWLGWRDYLKQEAVPKNAYAIDVTAQMWIWSFKYPNGKQTDTLYVPVETDIVLNLKSTDVNHAFYVPKFRIKKDVYPNQSRKLWFNAKELGSFEIACAEYCGLNHSYMYNKIVVMPKNDFYAWVNSEYKYPSEISLAQKTSEAIKN